MIALYIFVGIVIIIVVLIAKQVRVYNKAGSIYYKVGVKDKLYSIYEKQLEEFPVEYKEHYVETEYGKVHVIECGDIRFEPLVMFHAASVGSMSWKDNVYELSSKYHLFLVDTLGEGNKSELNDVDIYPKTSEEVAELYKDVTQKLGIEKSHIAGASYGGFICLNYAFHFPERVDKMVLIGSMGIAPSVPKVIAKLTLYSFFPYKILRKNMAKWAFGESSRLDSAREYFSAVLVGVLGRYYAPMTTPQDMLRNIEADTLIILGKNDNLVGSPQKSVKYTSSMKNVKHIVMESGHLINMEKSNEVNNAILAFL